MSRIKRTVSFFIAAVLLLTCLCGCSPASAGLQPGMDFELEYIGFEEMVRRSDTAVVARYVKMTYNGNTAEYVFKAEDWLYGAADEETIHVSESIGNAYIPDSEIAFTTGEDRFRKNNNYILILDRYSNAAFEHDKYVPTCYTSFLCEDTGEYTLYGEAVKLPEKQDIRDYICAVRTEAGIDDTKETEAAVYGDIYEQTAGESDCVAVFRIMYYSNDGAAGSELWRAEAEEILLGSLPDRYEDGSVELILPKRSVKEGGQYVIGVDQLDEYSRIYSLSVKGAVFDAEAEIKELFAGPQGD